MPVVCWPGCVTPVQLAALASTPACTPCSSQCSKEDSLCKKGKHDIRQYRCCLHCPLRQSVRRAHTRAHGEATLPPPAVWHACGGTKCRQLWAAPTRCPAQPQPASAHSPLGPLCLQKECHTVNYKIEMQVNSIRGLIVLVTLGTTHWSVIIFVLHIISSSVMACATISFMNFSTFIYSNKQWLCWSTHTVFPLYDISKWLSLSSTYVYKNDADPLDILQNTASLFPLLVYSQLSSSETSPTPQFKTPLHRRFFDMQKLFFEQRNCSHFGPGEKSAMKDLNCILI